MVPKGREMCTFHKYLIFLTKDLENGLKDLYDTINYFVEQREELIREEIQKKKKEEAAKRFQEGKVQAEEMFLARKKEIRNHFQKEDLNPQKIDALSVVAPVVAWLPGVELLGVVAGPVLFATPIGAVAAVPLVATVGVITLCSAFPRVRGFVKYRNELSKAKNECAAKIKDLKKEWILMDEDAVEQTSLD
jgi:hypothetical protein